MKNIKKKKTKVKKDKLTFPKQLVREELFKCPIWSTKEPAFVDVPWPDPILNGKFISLDLVISNIASTTSAT